MRIQHNILAMNSYRNYSNNTNALGKNLEKLSSGYKINRAGDDAAGLAISEKMRAQIQGLNAAQKNVKDGISLVKTAEGAMQEIQDMMSRMKYLATQSANGTYDDDVDRAALQDEVNQLRAEINRIADSSNFNGTKLLDGSLGGSGGKIVTDLNAVTATKKQATQGEYTAAAAITVTNAPQPNDKYTVTINLKQNGQTTAVKFEYTVSGTTNSMQLLNSKGEKVGGTFTGTSVPISDIFTDISKDSRISNYFTISGGATPVFTAIQPGADQPQVVGIEAGVTNAFGKFEGATTAMKTTKTAMSDYAIADLSGAAAWNGEEETLSKSIIDLAGHKYIFVEKGKMTSNTLELLKKNGISHYVELTGGSVAGADVKSMVEKMKLDGLNVEQVDTADADNLKVDPSKTEIAIMGATAGDSGLTLQIGDTADSYNQLKVSVNDMHTKAIGISGIDISTIEGAQIAIDVIKDGINYVSSTRGTLGAIQNRLEHTQNNLSVMTENIQDAESTIRDTDVADEMMGYVKNNILIQSAQAMLAQANQIPQGVLQLLG